MALENKALDLYNVNDIRLPGEQSVLGATKRGLSYARQRAASTNLNFCFVSFWFSCLYISSFSYFFYFNDFFLINEGSTVIG